MYTLRDWQMRISVVNLKLPSKTGGEIMPMTLKAARINAGLKQREVAEKLNVSRETIGKWESGKTTPTIKQAAAICELYCCALDDLIFLP